MIFPSRHLCVILVGVFKIFQASHGGMPNFWGIKFRGLCPATFPLSSHFRTTVVARVLPLMDVRKSNPPHCSYRLVIKSLHNYGLSLCYYWEISLVRWPLSVAILTLPEDIPSMDVSHLLLWFIYLYMILSLDSTINVQPNII